MPFSKKLLSFLKSGIHIFLLSAKASFASLCNTDSYATVEELQERATMYRL